MDKIRNFLIVLGVLVIGGASYFKLFPVSISANNLNLVSKASILVWAALIIYGFHKKRWAKA